MSKAPADKVSFEHTFKVTLQHIDNLNHVNNVVYLQWVFEVSGMHWNSLAPDEIKKESAWIVLRHEIDYLAQAYVNDTITLYTWIGETHGVKSIRHVHIYREEKLLATCKTTWCLTDANTLKPKRIREDILKLFTKN